MCCEKAPHKDGRQRGPKLPGLSVLPSCSAPRPAAQTPASALKERRTKKNKDEAAERRRPENAARIRPPRDAGCPPRELLPRSLSGQE